MGTDELTLGEYIRRLRKKKGWQLSAVADATGLSYHHLSRIENDSSVPGVESVALLSDALDGDLKLMLQMADCLPRQILDRISARPVDTVSLRRSAGGAGSQARVARTPSTGARALARAAGVPDSDADAVTEAIEHLLRLDLRRQRLVVQLLRQFSEEDRGPT
jgi:transcriptional regulator with XRE-family HTH domain